MGLPEGVGLGAKAPVMVPDSHVSMCQVCDVEFTTVVRRHHCRNCGKVIIQYSIYIVYYSLVQSSEYCSIHNCIFVGCVWAMFTRQAVPALFEEEGESMQKVC